MNYLVEKYLGESTNAISKGIFNQEGRKIMGTRTGKMLLGLEREDGTIQNVTWKQFQAAKVPWRENQKGETLTKKEFLQALIKQEKQFNKKVDYNTWAKREGKNASFEEHVDWLLKNTSAKYPKSGLKG